MKQIGLGLMGLGNIGIGTWKTLEMNGETIKKNTGIDFKFVKILEKNVDAKRDIDVDKKLFTDDPQDLFANDDIDIVIELLGGVEPAASFMLEALNHGKHVVTANKAAVAANYDKLLESAEKNNVMLRYEASVGGGIPILNPLLTVLRGNEIESIMGILNGTTNYILTQMTDFGLDFDAVLKTAQEKGFAEADPTADVEGIDVANKLSILMAIAFDKYVKPQEIKTTGITGITKQDIENAKSKGAKIKLVAGAKKLANGELEYEVGPMEIADDHPLASVSNEFNAVFLKGNAVDELMFYGKGAGPLPTGSAVVGDLIDIAQRI